MILKRKQPRNTSPGHSLLITSTILSLLRRARKQRPKIGYSISKYTQASRISNKMQKGLGCVRQKGWGSDLLVIFDVFFTGFIVDFTVLTIKTRSTWMRQHGQSWRQSMKRSRSSKRHM